MTDTKSGEVVSALVTAAVSGSILAHGADSGALSVNIMQEWCWLAVVTSVAYILAIVFQADILRSVARFYSGCAWGAVVLVGLWQVELRPLFWCALALFSFDFYAITKGEKWRRKSSCSASG